MLPPLVWHQSALNKSCHNSVLRLAGLLNSNAVKRKCLNTLSFPKKVLHISFIHLSLIIWLGLVDPEPILGVLGARTGHIVYILQPFWTLQDVFVHQVAQFPYFLAITFSVFQLYCQKNDFFRTNLYITYFGKSILNF